MKEFEQPTPDKPLNAVEITAEKEAKKEFKLIGKQVKIPGLILWEYNTITHELREATFKKINVSITGIGDMSVTNQTNTYRVDIRENCQYVQALNKKNAVKKIKKHNQL